jgi:hypothetical protein
MLDDIANTNRNISEINLTNKELIKLLRYEEVFNYVSNLQQCRTNNPDNHDKFTSCILSSTCPHQTEAFKKCINLNKGKHHHCMDQLLEVQTCMLEYTNVFTAIIRNVK